MQAAIKLASPDVENFVESIGFEGKTLCLIIRRELEPRSTTFLTPSDFNLQAGYIVYPEGHVIPRHVHLPVERHLTGTSEVLIVRKGRCELEVYNDDRERVAVRELRAGDVMVMVAGGHGFRMLEDTILLEVKQGPYPGVAEKERF
jgi:quercetin dioxygenase-like cupin family protein